MPKARSAAPSADKHLKRAIVLTLVGGKCFAPTASQFDDDFVGPVTIDFQLVDKTQALDVGPVLQISRLMIANKFARIGSTVCGAIRCIKPHYNCVVAPASSTDVTATANGY
jgi:hypothetical protein